MDDFYPIIREKLKAAGEYPNSRILPLSLIFIDVVGFSSMNASERERALDMIRSLGAVILRAENAMYLNTWGDAIVAAFDSVDDALCCACKFSQHFSLVGHDSRIGVSWGNVRISKNDIIGGDDFDGDAANLGARLEAIADPGSVLCSEEVATIAGLESEKFFFTERYKSLSKRVGDRVEGEEIRVFEVRLKSN
ncbi:adenylate/guanylate cyclase domain-containing protein [Brevundimonas sp. 2R-24]|uniref:Adenylate/guanylate cyclase domain-containing protein n=1 Tax=Peiella sedimenti TaxID=3061083 RepID=A0ABT8SNN2_9CAUL|nr:adenylate/guanylate cyclase domain-containing protein [Caulobacteraceae bacterium XZ-24]